MQLVIACFILFCMKTRVVQLQMSQACILDRWLDALHLLYRELLLA